jgi:hypothetical protein
VLVERPTPNFTVADPAGQVIDVEASDPSAPDPAAITADPSGAFAGEISLRAGTWDVTLTVEGGEAVVRRVRVQPGDGLRATLRLIDGDSYLEVDEDGTPVDGVSGGIAADGESISLEADDELRIRAGNAGAVRLVVNGVQVGAMGADGAVVEWRIRPDD